MYGDKQRVIDHTKRMIDTLAPGGGYIIPLEQAIRFLGDYLDGDTYFHVDYPEHNLIRTRTQIKLVADMEAHWDEMNAIVAKYRSK